MKKILIIGASGFIGNYCYSKFNDLIEYQTIGSFFSNKKENLKPIDYTITKEFINKINKIEPDIIIWSAGLKNISMLESNKSLINKHNFTPILNIVDYQKSSNKKVNLVYISSDYVFDGEKGEYNSNDKTCPNSIYGESKVVAEDYIKKNSPSYSILRVGAVIGVGSPFWDWLMEQLINDSTVELYDDIFSPTPVNTLFKSIEKCVKYNLEGTYHVSGGTCISRYEFGKLIKLKLNTKAILTKVSRNKTSKINRSLIRSKEFNNLELLDDFINDLKND